MVPVERTGMMSVERTGVMSEERTGAPYFNLNSLSPVSILISSGPVTVRVLSQFESCHSSGFPLMRNALTEIYSYEHVLISMCPRRTFIRRDFALKKGTICICRIPFESVPPPSALDRVLKELFLDGGYMTNAAQSY
ncbi:hypothetical protein Taro_004455 [Colocasia esculenta]|uniref:Uncharacterized protein n=1 Tax=Colocasia esculenta TaxID=4460 RepID=A0A843TMF2_COLES|nr:hypothetical protein [Colocasia esculenta]